eukprot:6179120-Pleurochrysis_carterae.AAC.3
MFTPPTGEFYSGWSSSYSTKLNLCGSDDAHLRWVDDFFSSWVSSRVQVRECAQNLLHLSPRDRHITCGRFLQMTVSTMTCIIESPRRELASYAEITKVADPRLSDEEAEHD